MNQLPGPGKTRDNLFVLTFIPNFCSSRALNSFSDRAESIFLWTGRENSKDHAVYLAAALGIMRTSLIAHFLSEFSKDTGIRVDSKLEAS